MRQLFILISLICGMVLASPLWSQTFRTPVPADKIIGIIGSRYITLNELVNYYNKVRSEDSTLSDAYKCDILTGFVTQKILAEMALRDSLDVSEDRVSAELDDRIRRMEYEFGSRENLERVMGKSVYQIKEEYKEDIRENLLAQNMRAKVSQNIIVTPEEVRMTFETLDKSEIGFIKASVEIGQVIINPKASKEAEDFAKEKIEGIRKDIVDNNKDFEMMAGIYSDDPGTRNAGGQMTASKDELDPAFASAVFRLKDNEISPVFRSQFGYHIAQMQRRTGNMVTFRHILVVPNLTSEDFKSAQALLDSLKVELDAGRITYNQAVDKYSNDDIYKNFGGMYVNQERNTILSMDEVDLNTAQMIEKMEVGQYSDAHLFQHPYRNNRSLRILYLKNRVDPHYANLTDDFTRFQDITKNLKTTNEMERFIKESAKTLYIRMDDAYKECEISQLIKND